MRCIALDVHRDFCEVAIAEHGQVSHRGRIQMLTASLELFAGSLAADDQVVLEATGPAFAIARIVQPHVARVNARRGSGTWHVGSAPVLREHPAGRRGLLGESVAFTEGARSIQGGLRVSDRVPDGIGRSQLE